MSSGWRCQESRYQDKISCLKRKLFDLLAPEGRKGGTGEVRLCSAAESPPAHRQVHAVMRTMVVGTKTIFGTAMTLLLAAAALSRAGGHVPVYASAQQAAAPAVQTPVLAGGQWSQD